MSTLAGKPESQLKSRKVALPATDFDCLLVVLNVNLSFGSQGKNKQKVLNVFGDI